MPLFKPREDAEYEVEVWFERDRKHLALSHPDRKRPIVDLWDEAVDDAIESGYLTPPRHPRPTDEMWRAPLVEFARSQGLIR